MCNHSAELTELAPIDSLLLGEVAVPVLSPPLRHWRCVSRSGRAIRSVAKRRAPVEPAVARRLTRRPVHAQAGCVERGADSGRALVPGARHALAEEYVVPAVQSPRRRSTYHIQGFNSNEDGSRRGAVGGYLPQLMSHPSSVFGARYFDIFHDANRFLKASPLQACILILNSSPHVLEPSSDFYSTINHITNILLSPQDEGWE